MDNIPVICAAGKIDENILETTAKLVQIYTDHDLAEQILKNQNRYHTIKTHKTLSDSEHRKEIDEEQTVKNLIEPTLRKFRFKIFEDKFFEKLYYQSAKNPLGKSGKCLSKPEHITNTSQTFGIESKNTLEPVIPTRDHADIMNESLIGHNNYIISHLSYFPSERINRNYDRNVFDPTMTFGLKTNVDVSGGNVKRIMKNCEDSFCIINTVQDNKLKKQHAVLSKTKPKQDLNLDPNYICGHPQRTDKINGKKLLQNLPNCPKLLELYRSISYLNAKRLQLKKKDFAFHEVEVSFKSYDNTKSGFLPWDLAFKIMHQHHLILDIEKIKPSIIYFKISDANTKNIYYDKLLKIIMASYPLPQLTNLIKLPETDPTLLTTYRELTSDRCRYPINYTNKIPEDDYILDYPKAAPAECKADRENLGYETGMSAVLSPSIPAQYGLSHRDYLIPRKQQEIKQIFDKFLRNIDEQQFLDMWNEAKDLITSKDNMVSVEAFKFALNKFKSKK